ALAQRHPTWFKLSAPYRLGGLPAASLLPDIVASIGPRRLLWGSDWPCTRHEACRNFADLCRLPALPAQPGLSLMQCCAANAAALYMT
ncbi:MAG TPA: amidohydrolase family protein, partial [Bordetella sp.]